MNGHETPRRITPWRETWRQLIRAAAPHQVALRRSLLELLAAGMFCSTTDADAGGLN